MTFFNAADGEERRAPRLADIDRTILALRNISKSYGSHVVLRSTDLEVERGEFITLLGPSGSGKTTILKIIGGFTEPSSGSLLFQGKEIGTQPAHKRPFNTTEMCHLSLFARAIFIAAITGSTKNMRPGWC